MKRLLISLLVTFSLCLAVPSHADYINLFYIRHGGSSLTTTHANNLAKYDVIYVNRFHYNDVGGGDTWGYIKGINSNCVIYLYESGPQTNTTQDGDNVQYINSIDRWGNSRGHSDGYLNDPVKLADTGTGYEGYFLTNSSGTRLCALNNAEKVVLDMGNTAVQNYWTEAAITDLYGQSWTADGVWVDLCKIHCTTIGTVTNSGTSANSAKYPTRASWADAMNSFIDEMAKDLHAQGQKVGCNRTFVNNDTNEAYQEWIDLDGTTNPPDYCLNEAAFAVYYGEGDVQWHWKSGDNPPEVRWKREVDVMAAVSNYQAHMQCSTNLTPGQSGTDNKGNPVTFYDVLWFGLASYQIGKNTTNNNSYFSCTSSVGYNTVYWFDEYDSMDGGNLDFGTKLGAYFVKVVDGVNVYICEFEKGWVGVNPNNTDLGTTNLSDFGIYEDCKPLTRSNFQDDLATISAVSSIDVDPFRGFFLRKVTGDPPPPVGNDFSGNSDWMAEWLIASPLTTDHQGTNTLTDNNTVGVETTDVPTGTACGDFERGSSEYLNITNSSLDEGFPFASVNMIDNGGFGSDTVWTKGTNWTISGGVATHSTGSTEPIEQDAGAVSGVSYRIVVTTSGRTAGSITPKIGGVSGTAITTNETIEESILATGTGNLQFVPTSDFDGSIDDVFVFVSSCTVCGRFKPESTDSQTRYMVGIWDTTGGKRTFCVRHAGATAYLELVQGHTGGTGSQVLAQLSSMELELGVWYYWCAGYQDSDKSYRVRLKNASTEVTASASGTTSNSINIETSSAPDFIIGARTGPGDYIDARNNEYVVCRKFLSAADMDKVIDMEYGDPPPSITSVTLRDTNLDPISGVVTSGDIVADTLMTEECQVQWTGDPPNIPLNFINASRKVEYYGMSQDEKHLYKKYALQPRDRTPDGGEVDDSGNAIVCPSGSSIKGQTAGEDATLTGVDIAGNNNVQVECPATVAATWTLGPSGDYTGFVGFDTSLYSVKDDHFKYLGDVSETLNTDKPGASGHTINVNGNGHQITAITGDENYWKFEYIKLTGNSTLSGNNITIDYTELLTGKIQNTNATGNVVNHAVIRGSAQLDVDAAMTINNSYVETVDLASGITLTAYNCAFGQSKATVETGGGTLTDTNCLFSVSESDAKFRSATDSRLKKTSPLINAGKDLALTRDMRQRQVPHGKAPDIGAYEARSGVLPFEEGVTPIFQP